MPWAGTPALPGLPGHLCPTAGAMHNLFTCLRCAVSTWGGELGDSSLILTAQHRAWYKSESIQLHKKLSLAPWA